MDYCIETIGLTKSFGDKQVVNGLSLRIERGSFYGFLGPNGAGKSTTIKMLTGILASSAGEARLLGYNLARNPLAIKRRIGVVPEDLCLFENLTAREYLTFIGRMYRLPAKVSLQRTDELLDLLGLAEAERTLAIEYSHGMKKKLALAAALIHDPELLFLDEPFEGIDAIASRTIRAVLERLIQRGATIFLTSHILEIVERLCTHVGIIVEGRLACQGRLDEVAGDRTLEDVFIASAGAQEETQVRLSWLVGGAS
jgi:ABC-2 type transport system ATP-binding protein